MFYDPSPTGSPLQARQNPMVYSVVLYLLIVIFIILVIWIFVKIIQKKHKSPQWIETHKKLPTKLGDIKKLSKLIGFSNEEQFLLLKLCTEFKTQNIFYLYTDIQAMDEFFKKSYQFLKGNKASLHNQYTIFRIKSKIDSYIATSKRISSSHNIPKETELTYLGKTGRQYKLKVLENNKDGLILEVPQMLSESEDKIEPLSKIGLLFLTPSKVSYLLNTRVVRNNPVFDGSQQILISHSHSLDIQNRRQYKRTDLNLACKFAAVSVSGKNEKLDFKHKDVFYDGVLNDISSSGCSMLSKLPIKEQQYIWIEADLGLGKKTTAVGVIVALRKNSLPDTYVIHIAFIDLPLETRIDILSVVYGYN